MAKQAAISAKLHPGNWLFCTLALWFAVARLTNDADAAYSRLQEEEPTGSERDWFGSVPQSTEKSLLKTPDKYDVGADWSPMPSPPKVQRPYDSDWQQGEKHVLPSSRRAHTGNIRYAYRDPPIPRDRPLPRTNSYVKALLSNEGSLPKEKTPMRPKGSRMAGAITGMIHSNTGLGHREKDGSPAKSPMSNTDATPPEQRTSPFKRLRGLFTSKSNESPQSGGEDSKSHKGSPFRRGLPTNVDEKGQGGSKRYPLVETRWGCVRTTPGSAKRVGNLRVSDC